MLEQGFAPDHVIRSDLKAGPRHAVIRLFPSGVNLFILHGLRNRLSGKELPISDVFIGVMPFFLAMLATLALVIAFPQISMWLVDVSQAK